MPKIVDVDQRRAELTAAAARLIAESGLEAATMRGVASEAGWTTGAITHYFADKRELLLATFEASLHRRRDRRAETLDAGAEQRLRSSLEGALPLDDERRRHWLVTLACCTQASGDERLARAQAAAYREFRDHVAQLAVEAGWTSVDEATSTAEHLVAAADGVAVQALFDPASWPPARQRTTLDALVSSQRVAASTPG